MSNITRFIIVIIVTCILFSTSDAINFKDSLNVQEKYINNIKKDKNIFEFEANADSTLNCELPNENYGNDINLMICPRPYTYPQRPLMMISAIQFDISEIPAYSPLNSAKLYLYYYNYRYYNPSDRVLSMFTIKEDWNENNITWNNQPVIEPAPISSAIVPTYSQHWIEWDITDEIQNILNHQHDNFGWMIKDDEIFHINIQSPITYFASKDAFNYKPKLVIELTPTTPPNAPLITGPTSGMVNKNYEYTFIGIDPDNNPIYYWVSWGDNSSDTGWIGPFSSGEHLILNKTWGEKGSYTVKSKVKDIYESESEWAELVVNMPRTYIFHIPKFFERVYFLKEFF